MTYAVALRALSFTDAAVYSQMDGGAFLSFLGYALVLLGTVIAVIGISRRTR